MTEQNKPTVVRAWPQRFVRALGPLLPLILVLAFYLILLPIGLLMRSFGRDPMARRFDETASSYRVPSKKRSAATMEDA